MENKNKNFQAIIIGFLLIFLVFGITIYKNSKNSNRNSLPKSQPEEKDLQKEKFSEKYKITADELSKRLESKEDILILDLRSSTEFQKEHLPNSENIQDQKIISSPSLLEKDMTFVLMDDGNSNDAFNLVYFLSQQKEYQNIFFLEGGFVAWKSGFYRTISQGDPLSPIDQAKAKYVSSDELKKIMDTEEDNFLVIDVRSPENFQEGHIKNSINIPLNDIEKKKNEIPFWKKIIFCDKDGLWAFKASVKMFDSGYTKNYILSDGIVGWKSKGYELVK